MALPMPTKRRSAFVQSPIDTCTPPGKLGSTHSEIKWLLVIVAPKKYPHQNIKSYWIIISFTFSLTLRHIFCIRGWRLTAQKGSTQCSTSSDPAEPRLLDQPLRPKLFHILICFLHPLPWRAQESAPAPASACCFLVSWRASPHTHW